METTNQPTLTGPELWREQAKQLLSSANRTSEERREGLGLMNKACNAGDPEAMYFIGNQLLVGRLRLKNGDNSTEHAVALLCRAAKAGFLPARTQLLAFRRKRRRQIPKQEHPTGPLAGFDGKEIRINRTGLRTPVDAVLTCDENGRNVLTLSLNLFFLEDEACIPDTEALHRAVVGGIMCWAGDYTVFGGQQLHVDIRITTEPRFFDNVMVAVMCGVVAEKMEKTFGMIPTKNAKNTRDLLFRQNRALAATGRKKWTVRSRKIICLQTRSGRFDDYGEITRIAKHEFGHVLGLGDLYAEQERGLEGVPAGTYPELDAYVLTERGYDLVMCNEGAITDNDMEMVVLAFSKDQPQAYQPDRYVKIVSEALGKGN